MEEQNHWSPVNTGKFTLVILAILVLFRFLLSSGWAPVLDDANLMFHEAGHPIFGLLGETTQWMGGTLGQLAFPIVTATIFWKRCDSIWFTIGLIWLFENLFNIARYMADARAQLLPLLGGGEYDWAYLFGTWQVLHLDTKIAAIVRFISWGGMLGSLAWLASMWWGSPQQVERLD